MNIQPLGDRVVIKPLEASDTTSAGIYIPQTGSKERPQEGEIVAVGPGLTLEDGSIRPMTVKVGQKVLFAKYGPNEVTVDGVEMLIANEADVLAVIG
ncbi:MAG: co-chaperone GroES [Candidatus Peregrinibacteria bacterium]|nr:co-chaperone GroES [Candidatus Peregrinibacteria bacterium]MDZ4244494.1 co-chaperone GroES [Candidatus Gracilibacteria bacterium]